VGKKFNGGQRKGFEFDTWKPRGLTAEKENWPRQPRKGLSPAAKKTPAPEPLGGLIRKKRGRSKKKCLVQGDRREVSSLFSKKKIPLMGRGEDALDGPPSSKGRGVVVFPFYSGGGKRPPQKVHSSLFRGKREGTAPHHLKASIEGGEVASQDCGRKKNGKGSRPEKRKKLVVLPKRNATTTRRK